MLASVRRRPLWIAAAAIWVATGVIAMHGLVTTPVEESHHNHGAVAGGLGLCVFVLAGGVLVAARRRAPTRQTRRPRIHPATPRPTRFAGQPLLHPPPTWCPLRA